VILISGRHPAGQGQQQAGAHPVQALAVFQAIVRPEG